MPFYAAASTLASTSAALDQVLERIERDWTGPIDLALVFLSPHHAHEASSIGQRLQTLEPRALLGTQGETIVAQEREIENEPALTVWLGRWKSPPTLTPFHLTVEQTSEGFSLLGFPDRLTEAVPADAFILTLGDPFTFPCDDFLQQMNDQFPGLKIVGGMASGTNGPGETRLLLGDQVHESGAVCLLVEGIPMPRCVVSQGCRPIGKPFVVTKVHRDVLLELGGKPALTQLISLVNELPPRDRELTQHGVHVGRVINEYQETFQRGDFLIRNVLGVDRNANAVAISDRVRMGQTIQFHVRDEATADEDLRILLEMDRKNAKHPAAGGWLFSCNGRGSRLFSTPDHDAGLVQRELGPIPLVGFFAQGEIGPVGGQNFIHGFTASLVLFEE